MKCFICCALSLVMLSVTACQDKRKAKNYNQETNVGQEGLNFIVKALESGQMEVKAGTVAVAKSKNYRVKAFADMMVKDHTKAGYDLKAIADQKLVSTPEVLSAVHQQMITDLSAKKGADFDRAYLQMMVADHQEDIALFKSTTKNNSAKLKRFAGETLPMLQMHLDSAVAIQKSLK